jgi:hypothetical protein
MISLPSALVAEAPAFDFPPLVSPLPSVPAVCIQQQQ